MHSVGLVSSGFFFAYAISQFLHGQISERFNPFVYISLGLICSSAISVTLAYFFHFKLNNTCEEEAPLNP